MFPLTPEGIDQAMRALVHERDAALTYSQKPRPAAFEVAYTLKGDRLVIDTGRKVDEVRLDAVTSLRLSYDPRSFAQRAYVTRLTLRTGRTIRFSSVALEEHDRGRHAARLRRLRSRGSARPVAAANPGVARVAGMAPDSCGSPAPAESWRLLAAIVAFVGPGAAGGAAGSPARRPALER
jgi:hypothetical protein